MVKMIEMYLLLGLIMNTSWAIGMTICIGNKVKWNCELMEDALDVFQQLPIGTKLMNKLLKTKNGRNQIALSLIIGYCIWPINIATGASRMPEVFEYIDGRLSEKKL